jgi:hypothetical protein
MFIYDWYIFPLIFTQNNSYYYTLYIFLLYKSRKIIWMFYGKFADEGINAMDNLNIYNVEGDNMLSPGLQPLTTESVFKIRFFTVQLCNCIFYTRKYFAVYKTFFLWCVPLKKSGPLNWPWSTKILGHS